VSFDILLQKKDGTSLEASQSSLAVGGASNRGGPCLEVGFRVN